MVQLMLMPLIISWSSKSRLVLHSWFYLSGASAPGKSWTKSKRAVKWLCVCVCNCAHYCIISMQWPSSLHCHCNATNHYNKSKPLDLLKKLNLCCKLCTV